MISTGRSSMLITGQPYSLMTRVIKKDSARTDMAPKGIRIYHQSTEYRLLHTACGSTNGRRQDLRCPHSYFYYSPPSLLFFPFLENFFCYNSNSIGAIPRLLSQSPISSKPNASYIFLRGKSCTTRCFIQKIL